MKAKDKSKALSEREIDKTVVAQADDDSAWKKPICVRKTKAASVPVLTSTCSLDKPRIAGISGKALLRFAGTIDKKDLQEMAEAIEKGCEQVNPE